MAFRAAKSMILINGGRSNFTTWTSQPPNHIKSRLRKGDAVPVCFAIGMIAVSTSLGIYTALHQLRESPNVFVKKSRRETIPEAEHVAEKFVKRSLFRKLAHIKDSLADDIYKRPARVETLKDVGLDPKA